METATKYITLKNVPAVDLTHTVTSEIPSWNGSCGFTAEIKCDYDEFEGEYKFRVHQLKMHAGIGTHIDSPAHCIPGGKTVDEIPLQKLIAPCIKIDISAHAREDTQLTVNDITAFESKHGEIKPGSFALIYTGWSKQWHNPQKYRNNLIFPTISQEAAQYLLDKDIVGLGIDTLSPDKPETGFPTHNILLGADRYIVENVANADKLPSVGATIMVMPPKIKATESPVRLFAFI